MKIVVALGGNALGDSPQEQLELVKHTAKSVVDLIQSGNRVTLVHGNGPQVGMIQNAFDSAATHLSGSPLMPLAECGAMSQGYIGLHLQNALVNELNVRNINMPVVTLVTQTIVDSNDLAFENPSKPIGPFYTKELIEKISFEKGLDYMEDSGRGYRLVVSSPEPIGFVELPIIHQLIDTKTLVIAAGGGGVPVIKANGYQTISAVIDKDKSSAKLADSIQADIFLILTAVDKVMLEFGTPQQRSIDKMSINEAKEYMAQGHFGKGSMLPKIEAAISFVSSNPQSQAIIASLEQAANAIKGETGTMIYHG